jgi:group I intron endonuclease
MGIIYKITSPTNRLYIGQTTNYPKRLGDYKRCSRYKGKSIVHNSIKKHGYDSHSFEIIEECENDVLSEREIFWIENLQSYYWHNERGMNMTRGGEVGSGSWMHDIERRKRQSKIFSGAGNPFYGKRHSDEFIKKKSKEVSEYNKKNGVKVPEWGVEKGRIKVMQPCLSYDKNGVFVKEFDSYTDAANFFAIGKPSRVWESISGRRSQCSGFHFREKTENYPLIIDVTGVKQQNIKRPIYWLSDDLEPIIEFPSAKEVSDFFGIPKTTINRAAMYNDMNPIRTGHIFLYKDMYLEEYCLKTA